MKMDLQQIAIWIQIFDMINDVFDWHLGFDLTLLPFPKYCLLTFFTVPSTWQILKISSISLFPGKRGLSV